MGFRPFDVGGVVVLIDTPVALTPSALCVTVRGPRSLCVTAPSQPMCDPRGLRVALQAPPMTLRRTSFSTASGTRPWVCVHATSVDSMFSMTLL